MPRKFFFLEKWAGGGGVGRGLAAAAGERREDGTQGFPVGVRAEAASAGDKRPRRVLKSTRYSAFMEEMCKDTDF